MQDRQVKERISEYVKQEVGKVMQSKQVKKVKRYRVLKAVFYCLGFPLFFLAVFLSSIKFIGNDPFTGTSELTSQLGFFFDIEILFTSPALYGVWIAFGVWMLVTVVHIILSKTVKSRRVRMLSVIALCLVVMLGGMLVMDAVLGTQVDGLIQNAPEGVTVMDYKSQLSYYRSVSSKISVKKNLTESLIRKVELMEKVYNVGMEGIDKSGVAGNICNKPVTYLNIIDDNGNVGVDIKLVRNSKTGAIEIQYGANDGFDERIEGRTITLAPDGNGNLVINGKTYSHYFYVKRSSQKGQDVYVWYAKDMMPVGYEWNAKKGKMTIKKTDGIYGEGLYNQSGLLSDGWIFSLDNVLEILEDYYAAKDALENGDEYGTAEQYLAYYITMQQKAEKARDDYYKGLTKGADGNYVDPWIKGLYTQEIQMTEDFSITRGELDGLIAKVGALLGDNSLFDYLLVNMDTFIGEIKAGAIVSSLLGQSLGTLFKQLNEGVSLTNLLSGSPFKLDEETVQLVINIIRNLADIEEGGLSDVYITAAYKANDAFGRPQDHLYIALIKDNGEGGIGTDPANDILLEIDLDDRLIDPENNEYAIDIDAISRYLSNGLNNLLENQFGIDLSGGAVGTIVGLVLKDMPFKGEMYKGLNVAGINIPLINASGKIDLDISAILLDLIETYYAYQSAVIKPVWEFYESEVNYDANNEIIYDYRWQAAKHYAAYERAQYLGVIQGGVIGSSLIGSTLGDGTYPSVLGLNDLQSVQQLKTDLSYQRVFFPLYALRDMLAYFTGIVILFYFISFIAAQKEEDYATGKLIARSGKDKKNDDNSGGETPVNDAAGEDNTENIGEPSPEYAENKPDKVGDGSAPPYGEGDSALPVYENPDKEVR